MSCTICLQKGKHVPICSCKGHICSKCVERIITTCDDIYCSNIHYTCPFCRKVIDIQEKTIQRYPRLLKKSFQLVKDKITYLRNQDESFELWIVNKILDVRNTCCPENIERHKDEINQSMISYYEWKFNKEFPINLSNTSNINISL